MEKSKQKTKLCMDAALDYLGTRMRSEQEMRRYLVKKQYREEEIDQTVARLKGYGYIDDQAFAKECIRCKTALRPLGKRALQQKLYQCGIDKETIDQSLCGYTAQAEQLACDALCEKLFDKNGNEPKALQRTQRVLISKGFSYDMIRQSMQKCKEEVDEVEG